MDLQAGALHTTLVDGRLGPIRVAGHEVWHGVHFLLRDAHWRTPPLRLSAPRFERLPAGWRVVQMGEVEGFAQVALRLTVEGGDDGRLSVIGEARIGVDTDVNRLGLCLLHPLSVQGRPLDVQHDDGRCTRSSFPQRVSAWPPFTAIQSLRHELAPGAWATALFEGDLFELEDQRNNADASFKTYSRSNFMPRPYRLAAGEVVCQRVRLAVDSLPVPSPPAVALRMPTIPREAERRAPLRLGVEVTPASLQPGVDHTARAAVLRPDHLHLAVSAAQGVPAAPALAALLQAAQASLRLDLLALPVDGADAALEQVCRQLSRADIEPSEVAVFPTTAGTVAAVRRVFPRAAVGGGTADFFVQLNRLERLPRVDFMSFTVCPIVHAADDTTVMASQLSLAGMLATLRDRHPGVPVHLGPSRLAARRSPLGELAPSDGRRGLPLAGVDPRDATALGAAWIAAHVAAGCAAGARSITVSTLALCGPDAPAAALLGHLGRRLRPAGLSVAVLDPAAQVLALTIDTGHGTDTLVVNTSDQAVSVQGLKTLLPFSLTPV